MPDVYFEEEQLRPFRYAAVPRRQSLVDWVMRNGFASDTRGAERVLICLVCICAVLAAIVSFLALRTTTELTPAERREAQMRIKSGDIPYVP